MAMKDNGEELFPIVDEDGRILDAATRAQCHGGGKLLHPVLHLHVFDEQGRIFLQHRPVWKDVQPDRWDTAVGGHVDLGESIEMALMREAREELSITDFEYTPLGKYVFESDVERELVFSFRTDYAGDIRPTEELAGGRFFELREVTERLGTNFFTPNFEEEFRRYFSTPA